MRNPLRSTPRPAPGASVVDPAESIVDSFNKVYGLNGRLLEMVTTLAAERDAARDVCAYYDAQVTDLKTALEACMTNDGTARYEYGEPRCRDAQRPSTGNRWATPHEIAKAALS